MNTDHPQALVERLYRAVLRIRRMEEAIVAIYHTDKVKSPVHLSIGQEAISVGVCDVLRPGDIAFGTYRGHALYLAKGGDLRRMAAELYGKVTGCGRGKSGSMHLIDVKAGMMGTSAIVATTIPQAIGYAHALKARGSDAVVVSFFGDAATEEGVFHETVNYAVVKKLPVLFVCENNHYAIFTPLAARQPPESSLCQRVGSYGIVATQVREGDIFAVRSETETALRAIREDRSGPRFIECMTYRWKEHVGPGEDWHMGFRSREEAEVWFAADPLIRLAQMLPDNVHARIDTEVEAEIADALDFAEKSPFPGRDELEEHLFRGR